MVLIGLTFTAEAQKVAKNAIGIRVGDNDGFGAEASYQRGFGTTNRLELDLGLRNSKNYDAIKFVGLYQWIWNIEGGFNWYAGAGAGLGNWRYNGPGNPDPNRGAYFLVAGDIGIEYVFDIPLQMSLDFRPELYLADDRNDFDDKYKSFGPDIAFGIRYTF